MRTLKGEWAQFEARVVVSASARERETIKAAYVTGALTMAALVHDVLEGPAEEVGHRLIGLFGEALAAQKEASEWLRTGRPS